MKKQKNQKTPVVVNIGKLFETLVVVGTMTEGAKKNLKKEISQVLIDAIKDSKLVLASE